MDINGVAAELSQLVERTRRAWPGFEAEAEVAGLAGLQFREFFTMLLPFYESVDVPGAAEQLRLIRNDDAKRAAVDELFELYQDEEKMRSIPVEL